MTCGFGRSPEFPLPGWLAFWLAHLCDDFAAVSRNTAGTDGGGIFNTNGGTVTGAVAGRNVFANKPDDIAT